MQGGFRSLTGAITLVVGGALLTGCAGPQVERPSGESREQVAAIVREREVELSTVRADMAATRIAAAKKEAELLELRALVAQLRQDSTETHQRMVELRQSAEARQADVQALKAERDQLLQAKHDQSLQDLKERILLLTKQLEDVRQDIGQRTARTSEKASKPLTGTPAPPRPATTTPESRTVPSLFHEGPPPQPEASLLAVAAGLPFSDVTHIRVQPGDSLSSLARTHHTTVAAIRQLNRLNRDVITVGQDLLMPAITSPLDREH